jgi:transposase-like protein
MKCCPKCGSTDIVIRYGGRLGRLWLCRECGYQDWIVVDFPDESLKRMKELEKAEKLEKKMKKLEKKTKRHY